MTESVSIIVVPRERFSCSIEALKSIYLHTTEPFELIYVDGNSPEPIKGAIRSAAAKYGFSLIRSEEFLPPNKARNMGARAASGELIVFIDNDVAVSPGWLTQLIECRNDTGADIIAPMYFIGEPKNQIIHMAGGALTLGQINGKTTFSEEHRFLNRPLSTVADQLKREPVDFIEFHCVLVSSSLLDKLGYLDEQLLSTREHLDFCMSATRLGAKIFFEPASTVTYLAFREFHLFDLDYFRLRWSDQWNEPSLDHFYQKWNMEKRSATHTLQGWLKPHQKILQLPAGNNSPAGKDFRCAQTNIELYNQCIAMHYSERDLQLIKAACEMATKEFNGLYRGSGKPFISHCVGTASILAHFRSSAQMIAAGLLHSFYEFSSISEKDNTARQYLANLMGAKTEHMIFAYNTLKPTLKPEPRLLSSPNLMALTAAKNSLLQMANYLDELLDNSLAYSGKTTPELEDWMPIYRHACDSLEVPGLYLMLEDAIKNTADLTIPESMISNSKNTFRLSEKPL
ncbi:MAG: glycosyltransferase [Pseudomonadales bacterium]